MMNILQKLLAVSLLGVVLTSGRILEKKDGKRLIKTSEDSPGQWVTLEEILQLKRKGITFMDHTDSIFEPVPKRHIKTNAIPTTLRFNATVQRVVNNLNTPRVQEFLQKFTSYHNRYCDGHTGRSSQLWLLSEVAATLAEYSGNAAVFEVEHGYLQRSIVARLHGSNANLRSEVVIIGGHLDSISFDGPEASAPGADDNGSGSVVVLEVLRAIVDSGLLLNRTVEFHWYAAEEVGLHGSQFIAELYRQNNVSVVGMLNLDVVGYYVEGVHEIGIHTDNASEEMIEFMKLLTDGYLSYGRRDKSCSYGCSDHASWHRNGYPAVFAEEAVSSPYMHTAADTIDTIGFPQLEEFVKLGIGMAVELGEPRNE